MSGLKLLHPVIWRTGGVFSEEQGGCSEENTGDVPEITPLPYVPRISKTTTIIQEYETHNLEDAVVAILKKLKPRLNKQGLFWQDILADTAYSSGENYALLESENIRSYIPPHGTYKGGPAGFVYKKQGDYWECSQGKKVTFRKVIIEKKNANKKTPKIVP